MDVFKILSRATKFSKSGQNPGAANAITPSSGQNTNPQLFRSADSHGGQVEGPTAVLGKRKRKGGAVEAPTLPAELDFFAGGKKKSDSRPHSAKDGKEDADSRTNGVEATLENGAEGELEERKRILRSHKIRVTSLSNPVSVEQKVKKRKKSSKAPPVEPSKKHTQVYPRPITSFLELGPRYDIHHNLSKNLHEQGYKVPTEVQLAALPLLLAKDDAHIDFMHTRPDLLSVAPTGSGKTLAFLIPIMDALIKTRQTARKKSGMPEENRQQPSEPNAIVLAPTKELANQIVNEARKLALNTGIKVSLVRKGMSVGLERQSDSGDEDSDGSADFDEEADEAAVVTRTIVKSDILVSTPLALLNALEGAGGRPRKLSTIRHFVLDEADVLLDPLFKEQTVAIWDACTNPELRSTLWSATMPSSIETLAIDMLAKSRPEVPSLRLVVGIKDTSLPTISHTLTYAATESGKLLALRQLLHPTATNTDAQGRKALRPPFLVFTQTIERAIALHAELKFDIPPEAGGSTRIAVLHSGLSETARGKVMAEFRKGEVWVIITTDLLARGVDFRGLNGVVNYDVPTSAAIYVHRVGRTGRAGREGGAAVTLYTKEDIPFIKPIANVIAASEKLRGNTTAGQAANPESGLQQWLLDALPTPSKREKQELKKKGVESRRKGAKGEKISTKSKYDRKNEVRKRQARQADQTRRRNDDDGEDDEFEGIGV